MAAITPKQIGNVVGTNELGAQCQLMLAFDHIETHALAVVLDALRLQACTARRLPNRPSRQVQTSSARLRRARQQGVGQFSTIGIIHIDHRRAQPGQSNSRVLACQ
jgi:hypothetical protein